MATASPSVSSRASQIALIPDPDDNEIRIKQHQKHKSRLEETQRSYTTAVQNRSSNARLSSRVCCCCSSIAYLIHYVLCYPTRLCCQNSWYDSIRESLGWRVNRPPEKKREIYCRYFTPPCDPFPDIDQENGTAYFSTLQERDAEKERFYSLERLNTEIQQLQKKMPISRRSSSCLDIPDVLHTRSTTPEEGEEEINGYLTKHVIEILPPFPENTTEEM